MIVEIIVCRIKKGCEEEAQRVCNEVHAFVVSQPGCVRCFEKKSFQAPHSGCSSPSSGPRKPIRPISRRLWSETARIGKRPSRAWPLREVFA